MNQLKKYMILFLLLGYSLPSVASVSGFDLTVCSLLGEKETAGDKEEEEEEEEPDCE